MATTKAGPPRGAGGPKGHSFLPLNSLLAKPELQDKALAEVSSRYAPVSREGPLPPALSAQFLKQIYGNTLTQLLKIETGQPQAQMQALERLRQQLDDAGFRKGLEQLRLHNPGQRPPSATFHHQLYHYLKSLGGTQIYWDFIKTAESNAEGMPRLDPVRFREAVQRFLQQQGPVTLVKPGDRMGALALFVLAFGLSQPEDAASLIHALLPYGSGFASFFGVPPGQEEQPSQEQAPQAQAPQAQATQQQTPSNPTPQSDAVALPAAESPAATSTSIAPPEPAAAPPPTPPEPAAQVAAAPPVPVPVVMSTPAVELADDEHWLAIQSCTSVLAKAYEELRTCSERFEFLQEQEKEHYAANDAEGIAAASKEKLQLIPRRRDAQRRVTEACDSLDHQVLRLGALLDREGADEHSKQLLRSLRELTAQARSSQDAGVARQMHQCAADIRDRLRMMRGNALRELEQQIERACTQLEGLGDSATETRHFLEARPYLDRPLETAELRLKNELSMLQGRLTERRRVSATESLAALARRLEDGGGSSQEELQEHTTLLETHAAWADREDLSRVGSKLASRISAALIPFQHVFPLWRRAVRYCWEGTSAASRLASVITTLPRAPISSAEDLAQEIEHTLLDAGFAGDDLAEFWAVLEKLVSDGNLAWARGLFLRLWQGAPAPAAQARWWLLYAAPEEITESRLSELVASLAPAEAYAVRCWAEAKAPSQIRSIPHPLFCAWLDRRTPCPPLQQVREALESAALSKEPAAHALLGVLSVLTQQQSSLFNGLLDRLLTEGFPLLATHLETFARNDREQIIDQIEVHQRRRRAAETLESHGAQRNPGGGPALEVWSSRVHPRLDRLRDRLKQLQHRDVALKELASLKSERMIEEALHDLKIPDINPVARQNITRWVEIYQEQLPAATEPPVQLPESFLSEQGGPELGQELERLERAGELGRRAAAYIRRLLSDPSLVLTPQEGPTFGDEIQSLFAQALSRPLMRWRFQLASSQDYAAQAGEDLLEELAGLATPHRAAKAYLERKRLDLAEALLDYIDDEPERDALSKTLQSASRHAREEMAAEVEILVLEPCEQALGEGARSDTQLCQQFTELQQQARSLLRDLPSLPMREAKRRYDHLLVSATPVLNQWEDFKPRCRQEVMAGLQRALDALAKGQTVDAAPIFAQVLECALLGNLPEARRYLGLLSLPASEPARAHFTRQPPTAPGSSGRQPRIRPCQLAEPSTLSRITQQAWDRADIPAGFRPVSRPVEAAMLPLHERLLLLLRSARRLHADQGLWRPLLARWAMEQGFLQAGERAFGRAAEYARDAVRLLTGEPDSDELRWDLDEALTLWLAARLEGSHLARAREQLPWGELRSHLRVGVLVRRFVEYRGLDVLTEVALELGALGGLALPRLLAAIGQHELHLRGLLLREVLRGSPSLPQPRIAVLVDLLSPWLDHDHARSLEVQLSEWKGVATPQSAKEQLRPLMQLLEKAGVPPELRTRFEESVHQWLLPHPALPNETRFSFNLTTSLVYLSAEQESPDGIQMVANVLYREGAGNVSDLKLAATLEHPTLRLEPASKIQEVGLLRPQDAKDIVFPLIVGPGYSRGAESTKARVTLLLYHEDSRGQAEQLSRRTFQMSVAAHYPHQDVPTPYITGKCVSEVSMIKGREKEVEEILGKLRGQHGDNFVLIYGMRRIGKSSLLQRLSLDERFRRYYEIIHLDLERHLKSNDTPENLLDKCAAHIREELTSQSAREIEPALQEASDCYAGFERYLKRLAAAIGSDKRLLLLFDEFQMLFAPSTARASFGDLIKTLRNWIQFLPVGFVVAGTPELKRVTLGPEQRLFQLGLPVELKALDEKAARELIKDPVERYFHVTNAAVLLIMEETDRLPNLIQIVCHQLFLRMRERQQTVATHRDVKEVLEAVSRRDEHFSFLLSPAGHEPARRIIIRALAELAVDEKRGTVEELLEHIHSHGHDKEVDKNKLEECLDWLFEHGLVVRWKAELRLRPALLARHVLQREEYAL